jgi:hypothetical protein
MKADPPLREELRGLEDSLANPRVRRSAAKLARLIADDFREFGSSGRIFDKGQIIAELQRQEPCELSLQEFQAVYLAADIVLVTYRARAQFSHSMAPRDSLRSSIWRQRNGKWEVVFHQGTPTELRKVEDARTS